MDETALPGGSSNAGDVFRVGNTVRRPRCIGFQVVESLLLHLTSVGFDRSPRFLGVDQYGRQVLDFIEGESAPSPPWQHDDAANAARLGELAGVLRDLHIATSSFVAPPNCEPKRPLPTPGHTWTHGDPAYDNTVYSGGQVRALIDWEFAAPADHCHDPAALLASEIRGPRPDADDHERRASATRMAFESIVNGYAMSDADAVRLPGLAAAVLDDAAIYWESLGRTADELARTRWRAQWFRANQHLFA